MLTLFYIFSLLVILTTGITFIKSTHWTVRIFDFPRLQLFTIGCLSFFYGLFVVDFYKPLESTVLLFLTLSIAYQAKKIIPFLPFYPFESVPDDDESKSGINIGVMVANVLMTNRQAGQLLVQIQQQSPDILLTVETDEWWEKELSSLHEHYPYRINCPKDNLYGMHLYSKYKLEHSWVEYLIEKGVPSIHTTVVLEDNSLINSRISVASATH